jgi:multidrug efflux pump subunit AcrB
LGQLWWVESRSSRGLSIVKIQVHDQYDKNTLPQVWDELRRKIGDYQRLLPPGAGPSLVGDDFGDVYGMFFAITGEGYNFLEMYEYAKMLQRELLKAEDVKRITMHGEQPSVVYVEMQRNKMAELGISQQDIFAALGAKNLPAAAGNLTLGKEYIPISPTGEFKTIQDMGDLLIRGQGGAAGRLVYLRDVATIKRGYQEPASTLMYYNGKPAIGLGISTVLGGDVMVMGASLDERLKELEPLRPIGMEIHPVYLQTEAVKQAVNGFMINLAEAVAIVVVVLLIFMGIRSGLIIGGVLLVTILGTFIFMLLSETTLERVFLGRAGHRPGYAGGITPSWSPTACACEWPEGLTPSAPPARWWARPGCPFWAPPPSPSPPSPPSAPRRTPPASTAAPYTRLY